MTKTAMYCACTIHVLCLYCACTVHLRRYFIVTTCPRRVLHGMYFQREDERHLTLAGRLRTAAPLFNHPSQHPASMKCIECDCGALLPIENVVRCVNKAGPSDDHPPNPGSVRYPRAHPENEGSRAAAGEEDASDGGCNAYGIDV